MSIDRPVFANDSTTTVVPAETLEVSATQFTLSWPVLLLIVCMTFISIVTVVGNLASDHWLSSHLNGAPLQVVLISFLIDKTIRQPSNYFIFSLAGLKSIQLFQLVYSSHFQSATW